MQIHYPELWPDRRDRGGPLLSKGPVDKLVAEERSSRPRRPELPAQATCGDKARGSRGAGPSPSTRMRPGSPRTCTGSGRTSSSRPPVPTNRPPPSSRSTTGTSTTGRSATTAGSPPRSPLPKGTRIVMLARFDKLQPRTRATRATRQSARPPGRADHRRDVHRVPAAHPRRRTPRQQTPRPLQPVRQLPEGGARGCPGSRTSSVEFLAP